MTYQPSDGFRRGSGTSEIGISKLCRMLRVSAEVPDVRSCQLNVSPVQIAYGKAIKWYIVVVHYEYLHGSPCYHQHRPSLQIQYNSGGCERLPTLHRRHCYR
jgi:hypothetical protein